MFIKFQTLRLCFRDTPYFLEKNALIVYFNIYFTQFFHRGTSWLKKAEFRAGRRAVRITLSHKAWNITDQYM